MKLIFWSWKQSATPLKGYDVSKLSRFKVSAARSVKKS